MTKASLCPPLPPHTTATRTSHASQPPTWPWQTPDRAASTVRPPHGQFKHAGTLSVLDTPAATLSVFDTPVLFSEDALKYPVGQARKFKSPRRAQPQQGARPLGAPGAQGIWTYIQTCHGFDSEPAPEFPHSQKRRPGRSRNSSQIPPTLDFLV